MAPRPIVSSRILIISNRLPVTVHSGSSGLEYAPSTGGLATGLRSLQGSYDTQWIGWPGVVAREDRQEIDSRLTTEFGCHPVFLSEQLAERFYEGFSNRTIWPIFHSVPSFAKYSNVEWDAYKNANKIFAQKILSMYQEGDVLWIHDYHLMLLPQYLRAELPDATIGFFLHIPFPYYEIFRLLPQHKEIIEHLLGSDLVGFHTHDYAQAFLGSVRRLLGHDNMLGQVQAGSRIVQVDVFPMGIDFKKYADATDDPVVGAEVRKMRGRLKSRKTVIIISRLDYTKGIPESLEGIREFFRRHHEWHEKIIFILVLVPSREKVEKYASLKKEIDQLVGNINSEYGTLYWIPVGYIYRPLSFAELIGLYSSADVALITPLRDGMNLVAKEYLAVKKEGKGVLILSEMAGASKELREAVIVNPNSIEDLAGAIYQALTTPVEEQVRRNTVMRRRLETHDFSQWVQRFFERLSKVKETAKILAVKMLDEAARERLLVDYLQASRRLLILDYDGTLVPFEERPGKARPDPELLEILRKLALPKENELVVLSGRDRGTLNKWLGELPVTIVAEHGGWTRAAGTGQWSSLVPVTPLKWKEEIRPIMELFVDRVPGSFIEDKDFSMVWHYRGAEAESASAAARELLDTLSNITTNLSVQVITGSMAVEARSNEISKGKYFLRRLAKNVPDFILAIGDDWTDEDLFNFLPENAHSIKVGLRMSKARFNVPSVPEIRMLLDHLAHALEECR